MYVHFPSEPTGFFTTTLAFVRVFLSEAKYFLIIYAPTPRRFSLNADLY